MEVVSALRLDVVGRAVAVTSSHLTCRMTCQRNSWSLCSGNQAEDAQWVLSKCLLM